MSPSPARNTLINLGSGENSKASLPDLFREWRQIRVDIDPATNPDILASMTDLSEIESGSAQAVWASHCLEHLYRHEITPCLLEIRRIISDRGFLCLRVPDLQTVAGIVAEDRLHEVIYTSSMGPVTPHDVIYGFGVAISDGRTAMAHRTGFTPTVLTQSLSTAFESFLVRRTQKLELVAVARKGAWSSDAEPAELLDALGL